MSFFRPTPSPLVSTVTPPQDQDMATSGAPRQVTPKFGETSWTPSAASAEAESFVVEKPIASFIRTLYALVEGPYADTLINWSADGSRVVVDDPEAFAKQVCPRHFRHSKWTSFSRLLNMYNFRKVSAASDGQAVVWEHDYFKRDGRAELWRVIRKSKMPRDPGSPGSPRSPRPVRATRSQTRGKFGAAAPLPEPTEEDGAEIWMRRAAALERQVAALQLENARLRAEAGRPSIADDDDGDGVEEDEPETPAPEALARAQTFNFSTDDAFADLALNDLEDDVLSQSFTWSPGTGCATCGSPTGKTAYEQSKRRKRVD